MRRPANRFLLLAKMDALISRKTSGVRPTGSPSPLLLRALFTKTSSFWVGAIPKHFRHPREIFALTTYAADNCDGHFTPSLIPASSVTKPGPGRRGSRVARPIIGRGWRSTANEELFLFQPGRLLLTFTVATGSATTSLLIVCWR